MNLSSGGEVGRDSLWCVSSMARSRLEGSRVVTNIEDSQRLEKSKAAPRRKERNSANAVLATKIVPPRNHQAGMVSRDRLNARLTDALGSTITLVEAPAGYGKTTALCDWYISINPERSHRAWLTADDVNNDPVNFLRDLIAALDHNVPGLAGRITSSLDIGPAVAVESVCTDVINAIEALDRDLVFVIDDFHFLDSPVVLKAVSFLANAGSRRLHLVIGSRTHVPIRVAKLRASGEVVEIGPLELKFTAAETSEFFARSGLPALDPAFVDQVLESAEGWPAGLRLTALSLVNRIHGETPGRVFGADTGVAAFLRDEVLGHLPEPLLEFIQDAAEFSEFTADLCDAAMTRNDSQVMIAALESRQLFLSRVGEKGWFRFHQLFADVLTAGARDQDRRKLLHERAAVWFEVHGLTGRALKHAFAPQDPAFAVQLLERVASGLVVTGRGATLVRYLDLLPHDLVVDHPMLLLECVYALTLTWKFSDARRMLEEVRANCLNPNRVDRWRSAGLLIEQVARKLTYCDMQLRILSDDMVSAEALARQWIAMPGTYTAFEDAVSQTSLLFAEREQFNCRNLLASGRAREIFVTHEHRWGTIWHDCIIGAGYAQIGDLERAKAIFTTALDTAVNLVGRTSPTTAIPALHLAELIYERNDIDGATALIDEFLPLGTQIGLVDQLVAGFQTKLRLLALGSTVAALDVIEQGQEIATARSFERLSAFLIADRVRLVAATGDHAEVRRIGLLYNLSADPDAHQPGRGATTAAAARAFSAAHVAIIDNDLAGSEALLRRWMRFLEANQCVRFGIRFAVLLAQVQILMADQKAAHRSLRTALQLGERGRFLRSFADAHPVVRSQLEAMRFSESGPDAHLANYHRELLQVVGSDRAPVPQARVDLDRLGGRIEALNNRESEILLMIASGMMNSQIADEAGLTLGTVKWYLQQIYGKLGVNRRSEAVFKARQLGLIG